MVIQGPALAALLHACAPSVGPKTMAAIIAVESGGNPYAIDDNTHHRSYYPMSIEEAQRIAERLDAQGASYDAGIAQVSSSNFRTVGLSSTNAFDSCANVRAGSAILREAYAQALRTSWLGHSPGSDVEVHQDEQLALFHAFSIYNSGSPSRSLAYARRVVDAAFGRPLITAFETAAAAPHKIPWRTPHRQHQPLATIRLAYEPTARNPRLMLQPLDLARIAQRAGL